MTAGTATTDSKAKLKKPPRFTPKKILILLSLFLIALGLAAQTEEILGCFTLAVDGFVYLGGTTSHKLFRPIMDASWPLMIAGSVMLAFALLLFPAIPRSTTFKPVRFHKFGPWKERRFKVTIVVFLAIAMHASLVNANVIDLPSFCPLSFAERASEGKWGFSAFFFAGVFLTVLLFGRALCSWVCVYGPIQEHAAGLLKAAGINPNKNQKNFSKFRLVHVITAAFWVSLVVATVRYFDVLSIDPMHGGKIGETWIFVGGIITFIPLTILLTYLFGNRFYCRNLCPIGGTMSIYSRLGLLKVHVNAATCDGCGICQEVCPMDVKLDKKSLATKMAYVADGKCIQCGECVDQCPTGSLRLGFVRNRGAITLLENRPETESA